MLYVSVSKVFSVALVAMSAMPETYASPLRIEEIHKTNAEIKARSFEESKILPRFLGSIVASIAPTLLSDTVGPALSSLGNTLSGNKKPAKDENQDTQDEQNNNQGGQAGQGITQTGQVGQGITQTGQVGQGITQTGQVGQGITQTGQVGQGITQNNAQNGQTQQNSDSDKKNKKDSGDKDSGDKESEEKESEED
ncbi:hypothetical protein Golomagni_06045 [Golovinomyces magnicellulatus]|nr:hypothetical protein Golomagni_06045 [Golovinomyces magnicellulatus]